MRCPQCGGSISRHNLENNRPCFVCQAQVELESSEFDSDRGLTQWRRVFSIAGQDLVSEQSSTQPTKKLTREEREKIACLRLDTDLRVDEIAEITGVSRATVFRLAREERKRRESA